MDGGGLYAFVFFDDAPDQFGEPVDVLDLFIFFWRC